MVLYVVGLGLGDEDDITVRGLKAVQKCDLVFLEAYTSVLASPKETLEQAYGKTITVADRNMVESEADRIYLPARDKDVAFLVVGDPLCATTHTDMILRAKEVRMVGGMIVMMTDDDGIMPSINIYIVIYIGWYIS